MALGLEAIWRRGRAGACACMGLAALAAPAHGGAHPASPEAVVPLHALSSAGASANAPSGWTMAADPSGSDISLRGADGAIGAEWGLRAVAVSEHLCGGAPDASVRQLLIRTLHALGDDGAPAITGASHDYADYLTGSPFETPAHRGMVFYHLYQWDENQSVISYYIAWTDKDQWSAAGYVAVNVALSIRASHPQTPLNPFWADGKQAEAEEGLRVVGAAYNHEAHVLRRPSKNCMAGYTLCADAPRKLRTSGVKLAFRSQ